MPDEHSQMRPPSDLSREIDASLASVWARYAGARPVGAETQIEGSVVRWILPDGIGELERAQAGETTGDGDARPTRTVNGYKREASAAVARVTHRRVSAMISKRVKKSGIATEIFILEAMRPKN